MERLPDMKSFCTSTIIKALLTTIMVSNSEGDTRSQITSDAPGLDNLLDKAVPEENKLLLAHAAISRGVKDHEDFTDSLAINLATNKPLNTTTPALSVVKSLTNAKFRYYSCKLKFSSSSFTSYIF